jgi:hypothetical protein
MKTLQSIPLGNAAADSFLLLDDESVGRIVRALVYAARNELPAVPKPLRPVYFAVLAESCRIRGAKIPRPQEIRFADTPEEAQDGKADNADNAANPVFAANAVLDGNPVLDGKGVEEKRREENRGDLIRNESESERAGKPASASASDSASGKIDLSFFDWYVRPDRELVPAALALIGEEGNARMRGRLGKAKRLLGVGAFREELATFAAELRAGEVPANPGATLNARLSAKEACR